jgi:multiple sugar transport system substrate-binding protein
MKRRDFTKLTGGLLLAASLPSSLARAAISEFEATSGETVYFRGWQFATDIVQGNVARYNELYKGHVDYGTITGDYPALMEQSLISKVPLDIIYAQPPDAVRWFEAGWLKSVDDLQNIDEIKADFLPNVLDAWTYKGNLLGLSYFVTWKGGVFLNLDAYEKAGLSDADMPKTWDELYDQIHVLHDNGLETPFLPHWHSEWYGISYAFVWEMLNRGNQIADVATHKSTLSTDETGAAYKTLAAWKKLWNSKLVPEEVLTYNEATYISSFASGRYAMSPQTGYDIATFNNPAKSQIAGRCVVVPVHEQSWGLVESGLYLKTARERTPALEQDVNRFLSWYGYKDESGHASVAERWIQENLLFSAYRSVMESPETEALIKKAVARPGDYEAILKLYESAPFPGGVWKVVWSADFNAYLKEALPNFLVQDADIAETIEAMNAKIEELNAKYGV